MRFIFFIIISFGIINASEHQRIQDVVDYLKTPEHKISVVKGKLLIDRVLRPEIDVDHYLSQIKQAGTNLYLMENKSTVDFKKTVKFMYESGEWNEFKPLVYDVSKNGDPTRENKYLDHLIDTGEGDCVTMSVYYYSILDMLKVPVALVLGPNHMAVALQGTDYTWAYAETTIDGKAGNIDTFIKRDNKEGYLTGAYMNRLSKKEAIATLLDNLQAHYIDTNNLRKGMFFCDLSLKYNPRNIIAIHNKAYIYRRLRDNEKESRYPSEDLYGFYDNEMFKLIKKARDLGFTPQTQEELEKSKRLVSQLKKQRGEK